MIRTFLSYVGSPASLLLVLKLTLLLGAASLVTRLLHRRSAATRHLLWLAMLTGALALAVLAPVAPRLAVSVPASAARAVPRLVTRDQVTPPAPGRPTPWDDRATVFHSEVSPRPDARRGATWPIGWMLAALWCAGFITVLLWSALGHVGLWGLYRSAIPVERAAWSRHHGVVPPAAGVGARVRLALSSVVGTPLTWGWRRPIILLPSSSSGWSLERRRAALLHELAHVGRGDYLAQLVAMLACAVYWFHPFVWWSAARLRSESEHACDDLVLAAGTPASEYANDLLAVAHGARDPRGSNLVAIGMARRSHLEGRLLAVLDDARVRDALGARARVTTLVTTLLVLVPFAGLELRQTAAWAASPTPATTAMDSAHGPTASAAASATKETAKPDNAENEPTADNTMDNTVPASPGGTLTLDLDTGGSVDIRSWDRHEVSVHVKLGGSDWKHTEVEIGPERGGVTVHSAPTGHRSNYSTSHRFEIKVPSKYDVRLASAGGGVTIVGVEGRFVGSTGGGGLVIHDSRGRASLTTGGGDIEVSDSQLEGSISTGGGTVKFSRVRGGLQGSSGSGPVIYSDAGGDSRSTVGTGDLTNVVVGDEHVKIGSQQVGYLHVSRAGGNIDLDEVPNGAEIATGGGEIRVRHGSGTIDASTGGGPIEIGPIAGSVSATTGAGPVIVTLASIGGREQSVFVRSGTGQVIVDVPSDLNARIELETAYTKSNGRATTITSAWALEREPVTDWDDSHGTPRRFVRAHGVAGKGEGTVVIRTVNGNVELRRAGARTNIK